MLWIVLLYNMPKLKFERLPLSVPLSKAELDLVQDCICLCALEMEMLSVCVGSSGTTLVLPHSRRRERREVNSGKELTWRETSRL